MSKSIFAARQQYWAGKMSKEKFNVLVARELFAKWVAIAKQTQPHWYWLCEVNCYIELKHMGIE